MTTKPIRCPKRPTHIEYRYTLAASAIALCIINAAPARASTVTDIISFSDTGSYGVHYHPPTTDDVAHGYQGSVASGSFTITFDPNQVYLTQPLAGIISNLTYSVTDPFFSSSPLTLNSITSFGYNGGALSLYSDSALGTAIVGVPDITIGINGWILGLASDVWYSQTGFDDTLTMSGDVSIIEVGQTPLPTTWLLLLSGFASLGFIAYGGTKKSASAVATA